VGSRVILKIFYMTLCNTWVVVLLLRILYTTLWNTCLSCYFKNIIRYTS